MSGALTTKQRQALEAAASHRLGVVEYRGPRGLGRSAWERGMDRLAERGLCRAYVHGGYEITDAGRASLSEQPK